MDATIDIVRETEFYQGYIRFKMAVSNVGDYVINDATLNFEFDEKLLHIARHEPEYQIIRERYYLGNIDSGKSKSIAVYFDPLMCSKGTDIDCYINYKDHRGKRNIIQMDPKEISVICPILKTDSDINVGRLKEFLETLPSHDSRIYEITRSFDSEKLINVSRSVLQKHDLRHVRTLHTKDHKNSEMWYYGRTKANKYAVIIKISILVESNTIEIFAATNNSEALAGVLAEIGRELKATIESKINTGTVNIQIKDSVVQRSNLLEMCDMENNCDVNLIIEDSIVQQTNLSHKVAKSKQKKDTVPRILSTDSTSDSNTSNTNATDNEKLKEKPLNVRVREANKPLEANKSKNNLLFIFVLIVFLIPVAFSLPVIETTYEVDEPRQKTETYWEKEPQQKIETYWEKEPRQKTEAYTEKESYRVIESYSVPLNSFTRTVPAGTSRTYEQYIDLSGKDQNIVSGKIVETYGYDINFYVYDQKNYEAFREGKSASRLVDAKRVRSYEYIFEPTDTGNYYFIFDNRFSIFTSKAPNIKSTWHYQEEETKYRDIQKTRDVTEYVDVKKERTVTEYVDIKKERTVTEYVTVKKTKTISLFQLLTEG